MNNTLEETLRREIVDAGRRMQEYGLVVATDGNISAKLSDGEILITPSGTAKGELTPEQLLKVTPGGEVLEGCGKPSSEAKLHLGVYRARPDARAAVHAHPPYATAFAVAGIPLNKTTLSEAALVLGRVGFAEFGMPGSWELPKAVERCLIDSDAVLLANHGALTIGSGVMDAYFKMETLEQFARVSLLARLLGGERELNEEQAGKLMQLHAMLAGKTDKI